MSLDQYRSRITAAIWQGMSTSGVDLSQLTADKQARLTDAVTDQVLMAVNDLLDDVPHAKIDLQDLKDEEVVLWEGRPFLSLVESYVLTSERIKIATGLIGKDFENYELIRVQDIDLTQSMGERMFNLGDIQITGADPSTPKIILRNIQNPQETYEIIRKAWLAARRKYGLLFREEM
jgi:hypothetical protein